MASSREMYLKFGQQKLQYLSENEDYNLPT